jgi:hypothetical protein
MVRVRDGGRFHNAMTSDQAIYRPLRFKVQDPKTSSYNERLTEEQWNGLKGFITECLSGGVYASDILRACIASGITVSRSQLDTQMKKWNVRRSHRTVSPSLLQSLTTKWLPSSEERIEDQSISAASSASTQCSQTDRHGSLRSPSNLGRGSRSASSEDTFSTSPGSAVLSHMTSSASRSSTESRYGFPKPPSYASQAFSMASTPLSSPTLSQIISFSPEILPEQPMLLEYESSESPDAFVVSTSHCSSTMRGVWMALLADSETWEDAFSRFQFLATLLLSLRCFQEACDAYCLMMAELDMDCAEPAEWSRRSRFRILAAISCIRSAATEKQVQQSSRTYDHLLGWITSGQNRLIPMVEGAEFATHMLRFYALTRDWLEQCGPRSGFPAQLHFFEKAEYGACWAVHGTMVEVDLQRMGTAAYLQLETHADLRFNVNPRPIALEMVLNYFHRSETIHAIFLEVLRAVNDCLETFVPEFDGAFVKGPVAKVYSILELQQDVASIMMRHYSSHKNSRMTSNCKVAMAAKLDLMSYHQRFKDLAFASMPFFLTNWAYDRGLLGDLKQHSSQAGFLIGGLNLAVSVTQRSLSSGIGSAEYESFVTTLLQQMQPACSEPLSRVPHSRQFLLELALDMAGLSRSLSLSNDLGGSLYAPHQQPGATACPSRENQELFVGENNNVLEVTTNLDTRSSTRMSRSSSRLTFDPPMARSNRSSLSSAFRSFKGLSVALRTSIAQSITSTHSTPARKSSGNMSWTEELKAEHISWPVLRGSSIMDVTIEDVEEVDEQDTPMI